jgi:hypothetical protein
VKARELFADSEYSGSGVAVQDLGLNGTVRGLLFGTFQQLFRIGDDPCSQVFRSHLQEILFLVRSRSFQKALISVLVECQPLVRINCEPDPFENCGTQAAAEAFYTAITDATDGVLPWIKQYW